ALPRPFSDPREKDLPREPFSRRGSSCDGEVARPVLRRLVDSRNRGLGWALDGNPLAIRRYGREDRRRLEGNDRTDGERDPGFRRDRVLSRLVEENDGGKTEE